MADRCRGCGYQLGPDEDVVQGGHVIEVTRTMPAHVPGCGGDCDRYGCPIPMPYPDLELCGPVEPDEEHQMRQSKDHPNAYHRNVGEEMSLLAAEGFRRLTGTVETIARPLDISQVNVNIEVSVVHRDGSTTISDGVVLAVWHDERERAREDMDLCGEPFAGGTWVDGEPHVCGLSFDDHGDDHVSIFDDSVRWPDAPHADDVAGDEPF